MSRDGLLHVLRFAVFDAGRLVGWGQVVTVGMGSLEA